jgi:hypothetical protein
MLWWKKVSCKVNIPFHEEQTLRLILPDKKRFNIPKLYWEGVKGQKTIYEPLHRILKIEHHGGERRCPERNVLRYQGERFHSIVLWFRRILYDIPVKKSKWEIWCQSYAQNFFFIIGRRFVTDIYVINTFTFDLKGNVHITVNYCQLYQNYCL